MKKLFVVLLLLLAPICAIKAHDFSDNNIIPSYANQAIESLYKKGIISGNDDGSFSPERSINRAEFCKIMVLATGIPLINPQSESFPDVKKDAWYFSYIESSKNAGWISGHPSGLFRPGDTINRAEISKILSLAFGYEVAESSTDQNWYDKYTRVLFEKNIGPYGISNGYEPAIFPSRSEIAEQVYRTMQRTGKITDFRDTISGSIITDLLAGELSINKEDIYPNANMDHPTNHLRGTYMIKNDFRHYTFLAVKTGEDWKIVFSGLNGIPCDGIEEYGFPSAMIWDCVSENDVLRLNTYLPKGQYAINTSGNPHGEIYAGGYLEEGEISEPFCEENCAKYRGVFLILSDTGNKLFRDRVVKNKWEGEADPRYKILLGCHEDDGSIRYYNHSTELGMKELFVSTNLARVMNYSSKDNMFVFRLIKKQLNGGMGAPACYSHFTSFEINENLSKSIYGSIVPRSIFDGKIVYTQDANADLVPLRQDCLEKGGTFSDCGSSCATDADMCDDACNYTCEGLYR